MGSNLALDFSNQDLVFGLVNNRLLDTERFSVLQGNLLQKGVLEDVITRVQPQIIIHCAGLTKIDQCERQPERAYLLNANLPKKVAEFTSQLKIKLLHISTATVFDGRDGPYSENDTPHPLSVYAKTKLEGEKAVLRQDPNAIIARVSLFGWSPSGERSLAEFFFNHLKQEKMVHGFTDVVFCPLFVNHLGPIFRSLMEGNFRGLYHVTSSYCLSKYEFGRLIAEKFGFDPDLIQPLSVEEGDLKAERSKDLRLNNRKLVRDTKQEPPPLSTGLDEFYTRYQQGYPQMLQKMIKKRY
ncbi:MAG: SDR family oxidoreductase [Anaerolineales bacterium]|nr:SDR family oxidoreductase [Anaerolineales bacterium]